MTVRRCSIDGCEKIHYGHGWCQAHYRRWVNNGDPLALKTLPFPERFWIKVDKNGPVPESRPDLRSCWQWTAATDPAGYGRAAAEDGTIWLAHRLAYVLAVGPVPESTPHLDHLCRNTSCVRPDHLEPVTQAENNRRAQAAKTHCPHGHPLVEENVYLRPSGSRECRTCMRESSKARYARKVAAKQKREDA